MKKTDSDRFYAKMSRRWEWENIHKPALKRMLIIVAGLVITGAIALAAIIWVKLFIGGASFDPAYPNALGNILLALQ